MALLEFLKIAAPLFVLAVPRMSELASVSVSEANVGVEDVAIS